MNKQRKPWAKKPSGDRSPSARRLAGRILRRVVNGQGTVRDQLAWSFAETPPAPRDEGLVTELVYGSVRHLRTLDHVLAALSRRPLEDIDETALIQLRLGVYQWLFLERIPPHAIVNEAVSLIGHAGAKKFVNGLLRGLGRLLVERVPEAPLERPRSELLTTANGTWLFSKPIFPEEQLPWLAVTSGQPLDYIERLVERHGLEKAIAVCRANNQSPSLVLRVNPLRAERLEVLATLAAEGVVAEPGDSPQAIRVTSGLGNPGGKPSFHKGLYSVQDETSQRVAPFMELASGQRVLDLCAAPGGKSTHIYELLGGEGQVLACDIDPKRLRRVSGARSRLGHDLLEIGPPDSASKAPPFDRVLADVPCSNTGVLRRRVEVRHRLASLDRDALHGLQEQLLEAALERCAEGGKVIYSTCSIEEGENERCVRAVLARQASFRLEEERLTLPCQLHDGGYVARLARA